MAVKKVDHQALYFYKDLIEFWSEKKIRILQFWVLFDNFEFWYANRKKNSLHFISEMKIKSWTGTTDFSVWKQDCYFKYDSDLLCAHSGYLLTCM